MHIANYSANKNIVIVIHSLSLSLSLLRPLQTDPTLLANNTQHCWAQQCCDLLRPFAWNHNSVGTGWHLLRIV